MTLKNIIVKIEKVSFYKIAAGCTLLTMLIGLIDSLIGPEISSALFYVLPIAMATWFGSRRTGIGITIFSVILWYISDRVSGQIYSNPITGYWNAGVRFCLFYIITLLLSGFRERFQEEELYADTDPLTGALNKRAFYEIVSKEVERSRRFKFPFSIAYIDLDNFKSVNDTKGHGEGDKVLKTVISEIIEHTRKIDVVSRIGGDEFAIMLLGTDRKKSQSAIQKIRGHLLDRMRALDCKVTFSIGLMTFETAPSDIDHMLNLVDTLMYEVKNSGKDNIAHSVWNNNH